MQKVIRLSEQVASTFYQCVNRDESHIVLLGGRSSFKSSFVSIEMLVDFLNDPLLNIVCLRKVGAYLRDTVYEQMKWAIYTLGVESEFVFRSSPLRIIHRPTNTAIYFYGVDDPQKLKGLNVAKGYIARIWFEELAEFSGQEDIDVVEDTLMRVKLPEGVRFKVYMTYNPPRNPYDWINEWIADKASDDEYYIHHSTYLDDDKGFLSDKMLKKIERYKETDYDYYRWMYLGEAVGLGDHVYNMNYFKPLDTLPDDDKLLAIVFGMDTGHQQSATACLACGITAKGKLILLDTLYYSPMGQTVKKAPSELSRLVHDFEAKISDQYSGIPILKRTIDSAEGALRNQYYHDYGIRWNPVAKKKKQTMIDSVISLLADGRFYYLDSEANKVFVEEHRKYRYDEKTIKSDDPKVIKEDDHTCDAFQYLIIDNARLLDLKA